MTEIIDLFGRKKELETLSATLVTITDMEDTDTDVVPEIVEIIKQLLDIIKTQQQSIENLACIAEKTIQLERGGQWQQTKNFDFAKLRAEHFGQWLDEAFQTMLDFSLENKFDCYPPEDHRELESVLEFLTIVTDMWMNGQIMVSSQERGVNEKK